MTEKKTAAKKPETKLSIAKVHISNILGIKEMEFEPGSFTEISGKNGQGKTSILEAINAALSGGHDATLLRKGEEKGEIVIVLDDNTTITKRISAGGSSTIVAKDDMRAEKPVTYIKALSDIMATNPIEFLRAPKKDRVNALFEAMPMPADHAKLDKITGRNTVKMVMPGAQALEAIGSLHKFFYDERTGVNRALKDKNSTVETLKGSLPPEDKEAEQTDLPALREQLGLIDAECEEERKIVRQKGEDFNAEMREKYQSLQEQIDSLKTQQQAIQTKVTEHKTKCTAENNEIFYKFTARRQAINIKISAAEQAQASVIRTQQTRDTIKKYQDELVTLQAEAEQKNDVLNDLDQYKAELLATLPIPGLEVKDGDIWYNGVMFDRLNSAQQVSIAVELAKLRAGKLGLICVDGIELLDPETYKEFKKQAVKSGVQMIVSKVSNEPLKINTGTK